MDLSLRSLWEWIKLFVRDPRLAVSLVKEAKLPLEVSLMFILLAGVIWAVLSGSFLLAMGANEFLFPISETEAMVVQPTGPILQGVFATLCGVGLGYGMFRVGRWAGGQGTLPEIMSAMAILELIIAVLIVAQFLLGLVLPFVGMMVFMGTIYVFVRGLGHVMNEGHAFDEMGKSVMLIFGAFVFLAAMIIMASIFLSLLGISPEGQIVPIPEEFQL